ncbi:hypothetical protein MMC21_000472 [Puttea exsequens]|nr:hypothetical protein [Puttea exsequens]
MIFFLALLLAGGIIWLRNSLLSSGRSPAPLQRQTTGAKLASWAILMLLVVHLGWSQTSYDRPSPKTHPIETLMNEASVRFKSWTEQASSSKTLGECVEEYYRRYKRPPPPGFDAWYRFATAKSSIIIDDFDTLYDDLKPFWGITPAEIRLRTRQLYSDPFNEASEIIVRKGRAALGPNFLPTHRWMLDGILEMIKDFATYLPDMDLAFNLNDEPKVAVPFQALQKLGEASSGNHLNGDVRDRWSPDRAKTWQTPEDLPMTRLGEDYARTNSFSAGTFFCPPDSAAQRAYHWDSSALCTSCAVPHSSGVFLSNWSLAASPCHQPDLRNLHGFYLSPAAHKPSQHLLPIFSQSKPDGYADILYPSPWNYIDKVVYAPSEAHPDPPFSSKESTLFWRGATSEGVSRHGTWRGMVRQRLVHLASNPPPTSRSPTLPILLPDPSLQGKYAYQHLSTPLTTLNLSLDISIVNGIARAWDNDGAHQDREFSFVPPTDFQDHWRYRYLMDVDGAGFSGRFLPFLQSRSLPFRAGIFRTWWDSRLAAWRHFVPVDVRLHGLLSTLAYFMGAASPTGEVDGTLREHVEAGEEIAEAGRVWAGKVLRKEDMEIFMFRLLLEWGRLTDDNRDEIGFSV